MLRTTLQSEVETSLGKQYFQIFQILSSIKLYNMNTLILDNLKNIVRVIPSEKLEKLTKTENRLR